MDASFSPAFFAPRNDDADENGVQIRHQQFASMGQSSALVQAQPSKKRRNQHPNPDDAEIIALSPTTLTAKNRFVCEVCNKGFQREQNLQLHRRGHNLPWKLKQKGPKEVMKRKLFLCPEVTCPHHDPSRALGDLTGIKKHYYRKHGEKKFKCDKCTKKYAVLSDCKAHTKTCGTRDYRCDCGTIFSRRDSFITHKTFCDALAERNTMNRQLSSLTPNANTRPLGVSQLYHQPLPTPHYDMLHHRQHDMLMSPSFQSGPSIRHDMLMSPTFQSSPGRKMQISQSVFLQPQVQNYTEENQVPFGYLPPTQSSSFDNGFMQITDQLHFGSDNNADANSSFASMLNLSYFPGNGNYNTSAMDSQYSGFGDDSFDVYSSGNLMSVANPSLYGTSPQAIQNPSTAHMSATALLQKAAQFGSTSSTNTDASNPLLNFFDTYQPQSLNADNFGEFENNGTGHLHDLMNSVAPGSSSSMFPEAYNDNVQDMERVVDQYYDDSFNEKLTEFDDIGFGSLKPDNGVTRDFFGVSPQVENANVGDVDDSSLNLQAGNTSNSSQSQDFGGPDV